jgi:hypothetical protein
VKFKVDAFRRHPTYLVIDIQDVVRDYSKHTQNYYLYKRFSLQEIIETILSTSAYEDHGEYFWSQIEKRFCDTLDEIDFNILGFFYDTLTEYLDETIRRKVPYEIDSCIYVFQRWVDTHTVILQHDDNAQVSRGFV